MVPPATATGMPTLMAAPLICVTLNASPSTSLSLPRTSNVMAASSDVVMLSSTATGGSLTGSTLTVAVAVAVPPLPSLTR